MCAAVASIGEIEGSSATKLLAVAGDRRSEGASHAQRLYKENAGRRSGPGLHEVPTNKGQLPTHRRPP